MQFLSQTTNCLSCPYKGSKIKTPQFLQSNYSSYSFSMLFESFFCFLTWILPVQLVSTTYHAYCVRNNYFFTFTIAFCCFTLMWQFFIKGRGKKVSKYHQTSQYLWQHPSKPGSNRWAFLPFFLWLKDWNEFSGNLVFLIILLCLKFWYV